MLITDPAHLSEAAEDCRSWLANSAFPLWLNTGIDWQNGGFAEDINSRGVANFKSKRLRSACRQIYVACVCFQMGGELGLPAVLHGFEFLKNSARRPGGGFYSHFDEFCKPTSDDLDTYDLAFVLFALAHVYRTLKLESAKELACELLDFMRASLAHPSGGFMEGIPHKYPRRQNPHMHMLEACLEWQKLDQAGEFSKEAILLKGIFDDYFFSKGSVREYFNEDWSVANTYSGLLVEPGHLFEWCWLLYQFECQFGQTCQEIDRMLEFSRRYGVQSNGLLFGAISIDGLVASGDVRLWAHAEWVRAETAASLRGVPNHLKQALTSLLRFLDQDNVGLWHERFTTSEGFVNAASPATTLYHITGAMVAVIELNDQNLAISLK